MEATHEDFLPSISPPTTVGAKSSLSFNLSLGPECKRHVEITQQLRGSGRIPASMPRSLDWD